MLVLDTETTGLKFWADRVFGIAYCDENGHGFKRITPESKAWFNKLLETEEAIAFHNAKFDLHMLEANGFKLPKTSHDTMIMSALLNENATHRLQKVAQRFLHIPEWKDGVKDYVKEHECTYEDVPDEMMDTYATKDAVVTHQLTDNMLPQIKAEGLEGLYDQEMKLLECVRETEKRGMTINTKLLGVVSSTHERLMGEALARVYKEAGHEFKIDSDEELSNVLYNELKLPIMAYTTKGRKPATDEPALSKLDHPIIQHILDYRASHKIYKTYCCNIYDNMDSDSLLHCSFRQHSTRTGRFSCASPNLQNIPRDSIVQSLFICPEDYYMFYFDYAQMEMRLFAHFANDPILKDWFLRGIDPYWEMAPVYFRKPKEKLTKAQRDFIKTFTLAILYGIGISGISRKYNKTQTEARLLRFRFHEAFPMIKKYNTHVMRRLANDGFVRNPYGRKRRLTDRENYKALNSLIQGTGADMVKQKIIETAALCRSTRSYMINTVHDELQFAIHKDELDLVHEIKHCMEDFPQFDVHMSTDVQYTKTSWRRKTAWEGGVK